jgi:hypothetical protein
MESLSSSNDALTLSLSSGKVSQQDITNLEQIYCLLVGSDIQSNDSICFVFKFRNELWIIPESRHYQSLKDVLAKEEFKDKVLVAQIDYLPFSWRRNKFLLGMEGDLAIKDISTFSEIEGEISILSNFSVWRNII